MTDDLLPKPTWLGPVRLTISRPKQWLGPVRLAEGPALGARAQRPQEQKRLQTDAGKRAG